ncbi:MAG: hypothetical protein HZB46_10265 [Solirubrobacterales bacterium]|nr:hypothetical protein [Solirubrobacterales bacterium]
MLLALFATAAAATGSFAAVSEDRRRVVVTARDGVVVRVRAGLARYRCEGFGDLGPQVVDERGRARIGAGGRFAFRAGEPAQRLVVRGRLRGRRVAGTLRGSGTIATGQPCASGPVAFRSRR